MNYLFCRTIGANSNNIHLTFVTLKIKTETPAIA